MSTCISQHGEYSTHTPDDAYTCTLCGVLDEDGLLAEIERLTRWQAEAMTVMDGLQDLGKALGLRPGERITGPAALAAVERLRESLDLYIYLQEQARQSLAAVADRLDEHSYSELAADLHDGGCDEETGGEYRSKLTAMTSERDDLADRLRLMTKEAQAIGCVRDRCMAERDALRAERDALAAKVARVEEAMARLEADERESLIRVGQHLHVSADVLVKIVRAALAGEQ